MGTKDVNVTSEFERETERLAALAKEIQERVSEWHRLNAGLKARLEKLLEHSPFQADIEWRHIASPLDEWDWTRNNGK